MLFAVRLDGTFSHVLARAEGSVNDATLIRHTRSKSFGVPERRFYLGDAGFDARAGLLTLYPGVRYHLQEWGVGRDGPQTDNELFNLRHSSLGIIMELVFGRVKSKFRIMRLPAPEYDLKHQVLTIYACAGLWNFHQSLKEGEDDDLTAEEEMLLEEVGNWVNENFNTSDSKPLRGNITQEQ